MLVACAGLLAPAGTALAQGVSDLQPPAPEPPASSSGGGAAGRYWVPGMPAPTLGGASSSNPVTAGGALKAEVPATPAASHGAIAGGRGEAVYDPADIEGISRGEPAGEGGPVPETHRVKKGDTLWDLASTYYKSPWAWPKLWALNPLVTNPHWIYPGDVLRLRAPGESAPAAGLPAAAPDTAMTMRVERRASDGGVGLRRTGFVEQGDLKASAEIVGSREEKEMLAALDEVYLEFPKKKPLHPGEHYSIYHEVSEVRRPGTKEVLGSIVEIVGDVEVKSVSDKQIAKGVIVEALNPVERHFRVGPLRKRFDLVDPVADRANVDAVVVATLRPAELLGESMLVFLDRGTDDGLAIGNRLLVVRRGDGVKELLRNDTDEDKRFPREVLGEVLVVDAKGRTATGLVTRSIKEVQVGDKLEARKGY